MDLKKYTKDGNISFCFGAFPTYELISKKSENVIEIILHEKISDSPDLQKIITLAKEKNIPIKTQGKLIEKLSSKENIYVMGVFKKYTSIIDNNENQVLLVSPSDMGNVGTIMREMLGFGYKNLGIIKPCVDIFNPKVIRASMGAIFGLNIQIFDDIHSYLNVNKNVKYPFMLKASTYLQSIQSISTPHTLIFGNEATGLSDNYLNLGTPILIKHTKNIDSLNLSMSAGIALYEFSKKEMEKLD